VIQVQAVAAVRVQQAVAVRRRLVAMAALE
jgi:hypothetical protein